MTDALFFLSVRSPTLTAPEASFKQNHCLSQATQRAGSMLSPISIHPGIHDSTVYPKRKDKTKILVLSPLKQKGKTKKNPQNKE
jgi:hypothetical protein